MTNKTLNAMMMTFIVALAVCTSGRSGTRTWTSSGDDGNVGYSAGHVIAWSLDSASLVASDAGILGWNPQPGVHLIGPGDLPMHTLAGTELTTDLSWSLFPSDTIIFVTIKAFDDATDMAGNPTPNYSSLGNIIRVRTPDQIAPAAIVDFR